MDRLYNRFRRFCAFLIGAVFFVSGLMKLLDPVGAGLVVSEYYRFFGTDFLLPSSKAVAVAPVPAKAACSLWRLLSSVFPGRRPFPCLFSNSRTLYHVDLFLSRGHFPRWIPFLASISASRVSRYMGWNT